MPKCKALTFCERVKNSKFCLICLNDAAPENLKESKCMPRLLPFLGQDLFLQNKVYLYNTPDLVTCYMCEGRLRMVVRALEAALTGLKLVQLVAHHHWSKKRCGSVKFSMGKRKHQKFLLDCERSMDASPRLSELKYTKVLLLDTLQADPLHPNTPREPRPPCQPPAPTPGLPPALTPKPPGLTPKPPAEPAMPRPVIDDDVIEVKIEDDTIMIDDDDEDVETITGDLPAPAAPAARGSAAPAARGSAAPTHVTLLPPRAAADVTSGDGSVVLHRVREALQPYGRKRLAPGPLSPPHALPRAAPPTAALSADDVDWEDKIPMDVITYMDAVDPAAPPAPAPPPQAPGRPRPVTPAPCRPRPVTPAPCPPGPLAPARGRPRQQRLAPAPAPPPAPRGPLAVISGVYSWA